MTLSQLLYSSVPADGLIYADVRAIVATSMQRNAAVDVTGCLAYRHDLFIQVLEGDRAAISEVFARLIGDPRHRDVQLHALDQIPARQFRAWSMGLIHCESTDDDELCRFACAPRQELRDADPETITAMLRSLAAQPRAVVPIATAD